MCIYRSCYDQSNGITRVYLIFTTLKLIQTQIKKKNNKTRASCMRDSILIGLYQGQYGEEH